MVNLEFLKSLDALKTHAALASEAAKLARELSSVQLSAVATIASAEVMSAAVREQEALRAKAEAKLILQQLNLRKAESLFTEQRLLLEKMGEANSLAAIATAQKALESLHTGTFDSLKKFSELQLLLSPVKILEAARIDLLGAKNGKIREAQRSLGQIEKANKPEAGKLFNQAKKQIEESLVLTQEVAVSVASEPFDVTLPGEAVRVGHLHPITQTICEMKDIMGRLGFTAVEGPEIEDDWHNFEALNIPLSHPARDPLDNFYLATAAKAEGGKRKAEGDKPLLLRSQTSTVQIRVMEETPPPVRIISLGRVYRPDTADATHYPMFHQIEGLLIDRDVTMADLKSVLRLFFQSYFGGDKAHVRFRPSFFPFTEPSVEVDMNWQGGWLEMGGAGMVDPNVLRAVGYDPEEVTGFAFGLGVERICMRQHGITDIRALYQNDVRFLSQF